MTYTYCCGLRTPSATVGSIKFRMVQTCFALPVPIQFSLFSMVPTRPPAISIYLCSRRAISIMSFCLYCLSLGLCFNVLAFNSIANHNQTPFAFCLPLSGVAHNVRIYKACQQTKLMINHQILPAWFICIVRYCRSSRYIEYNVLRNVP